MLSLVILSFYNWQQKVPEMCSELVQECVPQAEPFGSTLSLSISHTHTVSCSPLHGNQRSPQQTTIGWLSVIEWVGGCVPVITKESD